mmetsp:Transcript_17615/g.34651  ORF Transcript_17615/g.34651 Transcript_17615/m.34651 type:complete len:198 (+) Transcript_17615:101-694(+)|eukprot:CAMPEP_0171497052 /NCGR_PEP_ID=MMETSP0958-20121227/7050_1 /TAXON_ID=87120 /ORGANISM="Aurantiochytrium limacinum, Strain ATCCMYA-1381" /LENGTH=197 /DNA_ID=CAMNT_0012031237 /DNA_START=101 /DNA_END=694 /DNA_ORIENTATION=+
MSEVESNAAESTLSGEDLASLSVEDTGDDAVAGTSSAADEEEDDSPAKNALQENIRRKGQNAYYYAHASSRETVKNYGGEPPRIDPSQAVDEVPVKKLKNVIKRYSWADGKKTVKVYVPTDDLLTGAEPSDDNVDLDWSETSLTINLKNMDDGKDYELMLPKLHSEISKVSHKCKPDSIVITLHKVTEISWYQLVKK